MRCSTTHRGAGEVADVELRGTLSRSNEPPWTRPEIARQLVRKLACPAVLGARCAGSAS